ncbi:MAG TPA: VWA domain-containing protein [Thermoanaerobaculia bacterium]|nr:VWA domain-containing protein [Thermoanaerobaculia bacterium]
MKILALAVVAASVVASAVHAQSPLAETIEVRVTNIDVVVTDRDGKPVPNLTIDDFEILEDGDPQKITNFYEIFENQVKGVDEEANGPVSEEVGRRRMIIFVDNSSVHPLARNQAFIALEKSLDTLMRPKDEAMVVFYGGRDRIVAELTSDRVELLRGLHAGAKRTAGGMALEAGKARIIEYASQLLADANAPGGRMKMTVPQAYRIALETARNHAEQVYSGQLDLFSSLTDTISTLSGLDGKKVLIFLGAEMPEAPGMELFEHIDSMYQGYLPDIKPAVMRERFRSLSTELRELSNHANANGVTLYLIDTGSRTGFTDPTEHMAQTAAIFTKETNTPTAMANVAAATGGIFVSGAKGFEGALDTVAHDLSAYYSLGYRSPDAQNASRTVKVKVKRDGLRVRTRSSYFASEGDGDIRNRVIANVFHPNVKSDFAVSVVAQPGEKVRDRSGQYRVNITVTFPSSLTLIPQDDVLAGEFAVFFATGKEGGALSPVSKAVQRMKFPGDARETVEAQETFTYTTTLLVPPGEQYVSVGVSDTLAGTAGFARTKVMVGK